MQSPSFGWIKFNNLFDTFDQNGGGTYDRKRISDIAYSLELYVMQREQNMPWNHFLTGFTVYNISNFKIAASTIAFGIAHIKFDVTVTLTLVFISLLTDIIVAARKVGRDEICRVCFGMVAAGDSAFYYTVKPEIKQ